MHDDHLLKYELTRAATAVVINPDTKLVLIRPTGRRICDDFVLYGNGGQSRLGAFKSSGSRA